MIKVVIIVMLASVFKESSWHSHPAKKLNFLLPLSLIFLQIFYANHCFQRNSLDDLVYAFIEDNERNRRS